MVPSTRRPIPLTGRLDLRIERIEYQGLGSWVVKDPVALKYHRLNAEQYRVLRLLDGRRNLEEIRAEVLRDFPTLQFTLADVQHLITDLHNKGLVLSDRFGQGASLLKKHRQERWEKIKRLFFNLLYLRLPGWDPDKTLQRLHPLAKWMFDRRVVAICMLVVASSILLLFVQFDKFRERLPEFQQFFGWPNLIYLWLTLSLTKIIHEFGHGLSCKHYGGECHEMGIMLLVFSPCLYCDVSDSWMLRNKWHRIIIGAAGMYIEIILSAIAIFVWWFTKPGLLNHLSLNVFFVTTVTTVIFNANPLMRYDGYYMLADFLEIPNLRPKADKLLRDTFAWYCLGIESRPDPFMPESGRPWFVLFTIASSIYRWVVLFGITLFLYTVLKPYRLQSIGIMLAAASIGGIVVNLVLSLYRIITAPRSEPLDQRKVTVTVAVASILIAAAVFFPLPLHVVSTFQIDPHDVKHVYTITPGQLTEILVKPGDHVKAGQVLARLTNHEDEEKKLALEIEYKVSENEEKLYRSIGDAAQERSATVKKAGIAKQLADYEQRLAHLTIVAPCDGTVVEPPHTPEPKQDETQVRLDRWHGIPLHPRNLGCYLEERTHLLSVAPAIESDAILLVDQGDRNDVLVGQEVEIKFEHLPDQTFNGSISRISDKPIPFAPQTLSNKHGGELPTVTDEHGRERLTSPMYEASVTLADEPDLILPGMRGRARFTVDRRSAAEWLWRYLRRTFHFRL